ncbi:MULTISPECIES: hypothetical protein [Olivibacter]|uniref:Uncharacterized protein n=1 Tax=Olivibacter jilunii TaxID=985016 RepID=A0ABW6AYS5_9SPHI
MHKIQQEIAEVEDWLRNNPNSNWEHRFDMIKKLSDLNEQLNSLKSTTNDN